MKRLYVLAPLLMVIVFTYFYWRFEQRYETEQAVKRQELAELQAKEEAQKHALEAEAAAEGRRKSEEKLRADAEKKAKLREEQRKIDEGIREDTVRTEAELRLTEAELKAATERLVTLRRDHEKLEGDTFTLAEEVERMKIERRNAEIELQRATEMVAERTDASALVQVPLFPAPQSPPRKQ